MSKIREYIVDNYYGEAPVFTSFLLETAHPTIKYLIYTCMHLGALSNSYSSLWSGLVTITRHNQSKNFYSFSIISNVFYNFRM